MRPLNQAVIILFFFLAACGSDEKGKDSDDVIFSISYDAAEYYSFADVCDKNRRSGWKEVSYNNKDEVLEERTCSTEKTANIIKSTQSARKIDKLEESYYTETTLDESGRVISSNIWGNSKPLP